MRAYYQRNAPFLGKKLNLRAVKNMDPGRHSFFKKRNKITKKIITKNGPPVKNNAH